MFAIIISYYRFALYFLLIAGFLSACSIRQTQSDCHLNLDNAPSVRGLRLGMTLDEFREHFSVASEATSSSSTQTNLMPNGDGVVAVPSQSTSFSEGGRVYNLEKDNAHVGQLLFVDGRVAHFRIVYDDGVDRINWESIGQFVDKTAESLNLPKAWKSREDLQREENRDLWQIQYELLASTAETYGDIYWHPADLNKAERFLLCGDILISAGVPSPGKRHWTNGAFIQFDDLAALRKMKGRIEDRWSKERRKEGEQREEFKP